MSRLATGGAPSGGNAPREVTRGVERASDEGEGSDLQSDMAGSATRRLIWSDDKRRRRVGLVGMKEQTSSPDLAPAGVKGSPADAEVGQSSLSLASVPADRGEGATRFQAASPAQREPETTPPDLGGRVLRPRTLLSFVVALGIFAIFIRRLDIDPAAVWAEVRTANPWLFAAAFGVWYASFFLRAARWRMMLSRVEIDERHGYAVPGTLGMVEIFMLSWFANCIVPAKLGDAYRAYLLKQATGASFSTGLGTILAERLTDLTVLFLTMSAVAVVVFGGQIPSVATQTFLLGSVLLVVAAVGLAVMWFSRQALRRRLPPRIQEQYGRLSGAIFACLRRPGPFFAIGIVIWLGEGLRVWLVAQSLGSDMAPTTALFIALMGSLLTTLPITPAGLGVVEGGTIAVLVSVMGMNPTLAASIVVLDRVIGYWSVLVVGLLLYARRARQGLGRAVGVSP